MSTFLQLCQAAARECGVDSTGTKPTAVTGQTGELSRLVNWVIQAWKEIQGRYPNWRWMRSSFTLPTVDGTEAYAYTAATDTRTATTIARFRRWWWSKPMQLKIYKQSDGISTQRWLIPIDYEHFKRIYRIGAQQSTTGDPVHVSVDEQNRLVLGPIPNAVFIVAGDFQRGAQVLAANDDTPDMPSDFHDLIVFMAMKKYAGYESAPEVMSRGVAEGNRVMRQLEADQWPGISMGGPLA